MKTSEWVSVGHPDKMADYISSYILDRYLEQDPDVRYALEVQIKNEYVTLAGEITSKASFNRFEIANFVRDAVNDIGYTREYQEEWGKENTICGDELLVEAHIGQQSPDIARGVNNNGWGDQGIFWGMATNDHATQWMPTDYHMARSIGMQMLNWQIGGLDVKTQVTTQNGKPREVVVAVPTHHENDGNRERIYQAVSITTGGMLDRKHIHINGTGEYHRHGPVGDAGTTGRKLAVDFYGGNCRIGGGSPWTKDGTKADLSLNMLARAEALKFMHNTGYIFPEVHCAIHCRIGSPEVTIAYLDHRMETLKTRKENITPAELIKRFGLNKPIFADMCKNGLLRNIK